MAPRIARVASLPGPALPTITPILGSAPAGCMIHDHRPCFLRNNPPAMPGSTAQTVRQIYGCRPHPPSACNAPLLMGRSVRAPSSPDCTACILGCVVPHAPSAIMHLRLCLLRPGSSDSDRVPTMALAFDEFGRPFIILREQEKMTRLWGHDAQKASVCVCLAPIFYLLILVWIAIAWLVVFSARLLDCMP
jgi:hypothetical protein